MENWKYFKLPHSLIFNDDSECNIIKSCTILVYKVLKFKIIENDNCDRV